VRRAHTLACACARSLFLFFFLTFRFFLSHTLSLFLCSRSLFHPLAFSRALSVSHSFSFPLPPVPSLLNTHTYTYTHTRTQPHTYTHRRTEIHVHLKTRALSFAHTQIRSLPLSHTHKHTQADREACTPGDKACTRCRMCSGLFCFCLAFVFFALLFGSFCVPKKKSLYTHI